MSGPNCELNVLVINFLLFYSCTHLAVLQINHLTHNKIIVMVASLDSYFYLQVLVARLDVQGMGVVV